MSSAFAARASGGRGTGTSDVPSRAPGLRDGGPFRRETLKGPLPIITVSPERETCATRTVKKGTNRGGTTGYP